MDMVKVAASILNKSAIPEDQITGLVLSITHVTVHYFITVTSSTKTNDTAMLKICLFLLTLESKLKVKPSNW